MRLFITMQGCGATPRPGVSGPGAGLVRRVTTCLHTHTLARLHTHPSARLHTQTRAPPPSPHLGGGQLLQRGVVVGLQGRGKRLLPRVRLQAARWGEQRGCAECGLRPPCRNEAFRCRRRLSRRSQCACRMCMHPPLIQSRSPTHASRRHNATRQSQRTQHDPGGVGRVGRAHNNATHWAGHPENAAHSRP